ncbi:MAG: AbrB/MazE/SpoVT family DNA-binding domain-containing protein [Candidatus Bathyarchaeia archaeon]
MPESQVGSKGEFFQPKEIREKLGLTPRTKVVYRVEGERLLVEPIPTIEEVLKESLSIEISLEEFHGFRKELSRNAETLRLKGYPRA